MPERLVQFIRPAAIIIGLSAAFTWFGIYSSTSPYVPRFLMWLVTMTVGGLSSMWVIPMVFERRFARQHPVIQIALASAMIAIPVTVSLVAFFILLGWQASIQAVPMVYVYVYAVCVVMVIGGVVLARAREAAPLLEAADASAVISRLMERLPVRFRTAELWAVSSEDHYLRIHTSLGEELILMRLADAMRDLAGTDGLQTHRSWWVARSGVADARREGGKLFLILKSGKEAPVSRTYLPAVRDAGLS